MIDRETLRNADITTDPLAWFFALFFLVVPLLAGCVDSNVKARIDACNKIQDEALRVQCLDDVPVTTAPEKH